ncbi:CheR family methyltransferase [Paenibacillus gansuensis]|uniref:protein-glutamate O-methyltransferase n=1 Tax=Paenibacillus gansuensis TaxID=306542 RepID=A0ABW5P8X6_9BACL
MLSITEREYVVLADYIRKHLGIDLGASKKLLVQSRLQQTLEKLRISTFEQYYRFLLQDSTGAARKELAARLTTNHTYFMRETDHFEFLQRQVLPEMEERVTDRDLRIWSAGCSSGQEPYTLAMLLSDYFGQGYDLWDTKILATDLSPKVLEQAKQGIYKSEDVSQLPGNWIRKYMQPEAGGGYRIKQKLRQEVLFRPLNLIHPFPFRRHFHVIFCRNVMIYFNAQLREDLLRRFYDRLAPGGYLFIGHSESLQGMDTPFKYVRPAVYRK